MDDGKFEIYQDVSGQYRWRVTAANGLILAISSESYHNRKDCAAAALTTSDILSHSSELQ